VVIDPRELRQLSAFFAWTAWGSAATRPATPHSYTNNFPYEPLAGNTPTAGALIYSALSLVFLLGGTAAVLLAFGKFDYLGWHRREAIAARRAGHIFCLRARARGKSQQIRRFCAGGDFVNYTNLLILLDT
jgi:nitric oxide reductase large subunit